MTKPTVEDRVIQATELLKRAAGTTDSERAKLPAMAAICQALIAIALCLDEGIGLMRKAEQRAYIQDQQRRLRAEIDRDKEREASNQHYNLKRLRPSICPLCLEIILPDQAIGIIGGKVYHQPCYRVVLIYANRKHIHSESHAR